MIQTSLMPTVIALSSFFASNFPHISWYPYWYLGNQYKFLIGPVVPTLLAIFNSYLGLIFLSLFLGALGVYFLLKEFGAGKKQAVLSAVFYLILPGGFYLLNFQNGLNHIAFGLLPFIFILYRRWLGKIHLGGAHSVTPEVMHGLLLSILIAFALLINVSILLSLVIGFIAMLFALKNKGDWGDLVIKSVLIVLLGISLATIWYTPKFWWVLLSNPSFGGAPLINVFWSLFKLLLNLLPLVLALLAVKMTKFRPKGYLLFAVLFFSSFLFLSIIRLLSDPDFIADWIGFGLELQFGGAIIGGAILLKLWRKNIRWRITVCGLLIMVALLNGYIVFNNLTIKQFNNDYQDRIVSMLKNVPENERVFLSGSPVFFINSNLNIQQVRGGVDQVSIHPFWAHGAYQIREGQDAELASDWLTALGASYILVHQNNSKDNFRDFRNTKRFFDQNYFNLTAEENGDQLYKVKGATIARIADAKILEIPKPKNGADEEALSQYASLLKRPLDFSFQKPNEISFKGSFGQNEVVSLAVSYDSGLRIVKGQGSILPDSLGNIVIIPKKEGQQEFILMFKEGNLTFWPPALLSFILVVLIINYNRVLPNLKKSFQVFLLVLERMIIGKLTMNHLPLTID